MSKVEIFNKSVELYLAFNRAGYLECKSLEDYLEGLAKVMPVPYAYEHRVYNQADEKVFFDKWYPAETASTDEFYRFQDDVQRVRDMFDYYNHKNQLMWTMIAYVWENRLEHGAITYYEQDCMNEDYYIDMGRMIKESLENE